MTAPLLKIEHLEVHYGDLIGVSDVSLEVPRGSVVAMLVLALTAPGIWRRSPTRTASR